MVLSESLLYITLRHFFPEPLHLKIDKLWHEPKEDFLLPGWLSILHYIIISIKVEKVRNTVSSNIFSSTLSPAS